MTPKMYEQFRARMFANISNAWFAVFVIYAVMDVLQHAHVTGFIDLSVAYVWHRIALFLERS